MEERIEILIAKDFSRIEVRMRGIEVLTGLYGHLTPEQMIWATTKTVEGVLMFLAKEAKKSEG